MRALLAILFSFLFAGMQAAAPSVATAAATGQALAAKCGCSGCKTSCCPTPAGRSSVPLPAVPPSVQHQLDWQGLPEHSSPALCLAPRQGQIVAQPPTLSSKGSVPLYEWNCAYLI